MYELIQVGEKTYYIDCPSRMGVYVPDDEHVCLIDGGSDKDAAKKALRILESRGWKLEKVFNTHSHADHDGGNAVLQQKYNIPVTCQNPDAILIENTLIQPTTLYGAYPNKDMLTKFFYAQPSKVDIFEEIRKFKQLFDEGIITEDEFNKKKKELLNL